MNRKYVLLFAAVVVVLLVMIERYNRDMTWQGVDSVRDRLSLALRNQLEKKKVDSLRFALVLSQNSALIDALDNDDEDRGYAILSELMRSVEDYTNAVIRTQIITSDYTIFARSWDNSFAGMPIDEYRPDLRYFQQNKKPRSAIEVGRRLGIKATVPIYKQKQALGFVEVLQFFESTTDFFRHMGVDLYMLMDDRFYPIAILMQENPAVGPYIVANRRYNAANIELLDSIDYETLAQRGVTNRDGKYVLFEPMHNGSGEKIGAYVFVLGEATMQRYAQSRDDISFLINFTRSDLYDIARQESFESRFFQSVYDKELLYIKDVVPEEDRQLFVDEAYERLNAYSKEELIALMLGHKVSRKIQGEIR